MSQFTSSIEIKSIFFFGDKKEKKGINFNKKIKVINGASNTGKSFLIESLEYMLGKESIELVDECKKFCEAKLEIYLNSVPYTLVRKFDSKVTDVFKGHVDHKASPKLFTTLKIGSPRKDEQSFSSFFLKEWGQDRVELIKNLSATKKVLSFRLLSTTFVSEEEKIISKNSPIESGARDEKTLNRSIFTYLLTGNDHSSYDELIKKDIFDGQKRGKAELLSELIEDYRSEIKFKNDSINTLKQNLERNEQFLEEVKKTLNASKKDTGVLLSRKNEITKEIATHNLRLNDIKSNLSNFESLKEIYISDINRLESQEEASFLLSSNHNGYCGTCEQKSEKICSDLEQLELLRKASLAEIKIIEKNRKDLQETNSKLNKQLANIDRQNETLKEELRAIEAKINLRTPALEDLEFIYSDLIESKTALVREISLLENIHNLQIKLQELETEKPPQKYKTEDFLPPEQAINAFCDIYSEVLSEIRFPGNQLVTFDYKHYDVVIDGKPRRQNGKGVRAILHSVFKIALLLYCSRNRLFHPKILVLDSPLVTYRDPTDSKHGELDDDEKSIANTKLSYHFLKYLDTLADVAQFIVIENIDIPNIDSKNLSVETFHGKNASTHERKGLL